MVLKGNMVWNSNIVFDNVFDHCAQTLKTRKLKLCDFNINLWSIKKSYFWFPGLSGVTIATSLSKSTRDFLKLSFRLYVSL